MIDFTIIDRYDHLLSVLSTCHVAFLKEEKHTLEEYFMKFYGGDKND